MSASSQSAHSAASATSAVDITTSSGEAGSGSPPRPSSSASASPSLRGPAALAAVNSAGISSPPSGPTSSSDQDGCVDSAASQSLPPTRLSPLIHRHLGYVTPPAGYPPLCSVPSSKRLKAPAIGVAAGPRFPDAPLFESPEELDGFLQRLSPSPDRAEASSRDPRKRRVPPAKPPEPSPRSILRVRSGTSEIPSPTDPVRQTRRRTDDPAMQPVSPSSPDIDDAQAESPCSSPARSEAYSPLRTPTPSPPKSSVPAGFRPDGLMTAEVPPASSAESLTQDPSPESAPAESRPSTMEDNSASSAELADSELPAPSSITELWNRPQARDVDRSLENLDRTRLVAYALLRPPCPTNYASRRDFLSAHSPRELLAMLQTAYPAPPCSSQELAELRVQIGKLSRENQALTRRMDSALASAARLEQDLAVIVRERNEWKKNALRNTELISSFRKNVVRLKCQVREATRHAKSRVDSSQELIDDLRRQIQARSTDLERMSSQIVERDVAYAALQGVASSYFSMIQEAARVVSKGGSTRALRLAQDTIVAQQRTITQQKNIIRHSGKVTVSDPALAIAAASGVDAPGFSPSDLHLNTRLCRLLESRWPELSRVEPGDTRGITLCVGPSQASTTQRSLASTLPATTSEVIPAVSTSNSAIVHPTTHRRVPESRFRRDHLTPQTNPSVHVPALPVTPPSDPVASSACLDSRSDTESAVAALSLLGSASPAQSTQLASITQNSSARKTKKTSKKSTPSPTRRSSRAASRDARAIGRIQLDNLEASDRDVLGPAASSPGSAEQPPKQDDSASSSISLDPSEEDFDSEVAIPMSARRKKSLADAQKSKLLKELFSSSDDSEEEKDAAPPTSPPSAPVAQSTGSLSASAGYLPSGVSSHPLSAAQANRSRPLSPRSSVKKPRRSPKSSATQKRSIRSPVKAPKSPKKNNAKQKSQLSSISVLPSSDSAAANPVSSSVTGNSAADPSVTGQLPVVLALPIAQLRRRAAQAATRESRVPS
ncbi:hypothetical protein PHYPSEUDO_006267 [Phytophthora pseudosyringae]|uniref:Uncharacterized protein n=1 Tax=Phytophthora pseudosyringae TaxID=221518 RepID=A0A8T1VJ97_9STRA|nr:hypothetical protein PHYPSEUDO_006267 [Phytophthora pseudosyringae]